MSLRERESIGKANITEAAPKRCSSTACFPVDTKAAQAKGFDRHELAHPSQTLAGGLRDDFPLPIAEGDKPVNWATELIEPLMFRQHFPNLRSSILPYSNSQLKKLARPANGRVPQAQDAALSTVTTGWIFSQRGSDGHLALREPAISGPATREYLSHAAQFEFSRNACIFLSFPGSAWERLFPTLRVVSRSPREAEPRERVFPSRAWEQENKKFPSGNVAGVCRQPCLLDSGRHAPRDGRSARHAFETLGRHARPASADIPLLTRSVKATLGERRGVSPTWTRCGAENTSR